MDSREGDPVTLSVGPVLSRDDAVGNKASALYSRAEARDYRDVDSIRASGKFTDAELIAAVRDRDLGFEVPMFNTQLDAAQRLHPEQAARYGVEPAQLDAIKERFRQWATKLACSPPRPNCPGGSQQLDPELQRIVDLTKLDYSTSATEIRPPSTENGTDGRRYRSPTGQNRSNDRGCGR